VSISSFCIFGLSKRYDPESKEGNLPTPLGHLIEKYFNVGNERAFDLPLMKIFDWDAS
jgi:hypothetical protein